MGCSAGQVLVYIISILISIIIIIIVIKGLGIILKRRGDFQQISCRLKISSLGSQFIKFKGDHQFYPLSYWGNPYIHIALTSPLISSPGVKKFCCRRFFGGTKVCSSSSSPNASHFWHILMLKPPRFVFENIRFLCWNKSLQQQQFTRCTRSRQNKWLRLVLSVSLTTF